MSETSAAETALPNHSWPLSWMMMKSNCVLMPTPVKSRPRYPLANWLP
jgi:hypothetical protein